MVLVHGGLHVRGKLPLEAGTLGFQHNLPLDLEETPGGVGRR